VFRFVSAVGLETGSGRAGPGLIFSAVQGSNRHPLRSREAITVSPITGQSDICRRNIDDNTASVRQRSRERFNCDRASRANSSVQATILLMEARRPAPRVTLVISTIQRGPPTTSHAARSTCYDAPMYRLHLVHRARMSSEHDS